MTYGAVVQRAITAAKEAEEAHGLSVEVIDLRSLTPVDWDAVMGSVRKTNRVIVAYEDSLSWGYGAELAARIADEAFEWLDRSGPSSGLDRHLRSVCPAAGRRDPAAGRTSPHGDDRNRGLLSRARHARRRYLDSSGGYPSRSPSLP